MIDAADDFELIEIEGDAAFLSRQADNLDADATAAAMNRVVAGMHRRVPPRAPVRRVQPVSVRRLRAGEQSEAEVRRARRRGRDPDDPGSPQARRDRCHPGPPVAEELRPASEYVLFSEELYRNGGGAFDPVQQVEQDLEGIGRVRTYFADIAGSLPPMPHPSRLARLARTVDVAGRGIPYMLGLRRPRRVASEA